MGGTLAERGVLSPRPVPHSGGEDAGDLRSVLPAFHRAQGDPGTVRALLDRAENVIFLGPPGVGKTHLAIALGVKAVEVGYWVLFLSFEDFLGKLRKAQVEKKLEKMLSVLTLPKLLILDEIGYLPLSPEESSLFFRLLCRRYEEASLILTSNKSFLDWGDVFGDQTLATAILDRLLHHATMVNINGESFRPHGIKNPCHQERHTEGRRNPGMKTPGTKDLPKDFFRGNRDIFFWRKVDRLNPEKRTIFFLLDTLAGGHPRFVAWVEETIGETFTFLKLPRAHHRSLKSTNVLERWNEEIKRRTRVVRIFPNAESCLRLIRALCSEVHDNWVSGKRYLDMTGEKPEKKRSMAVA